MAEPRIASLSLSLAALLLVSPGAGSTQAGPTQDRLRWRPPVSPVVVVRQFDPPDQRWLPGHRGVDLRTTPGAQVRAAGDGRVAFAGTLAGRGVISIDHGELRTTYEPVEAQVLVGEKVRAGESIGTVGAGSGHCGSGSCLHLGLRRGRQYLDPMLLLGRTSARLRPW
jgi:murein DD-endopeptidase MepM/ murein hydrolase activator NlpD